MNKDSLAHYIRVISVPPVMITGLVILLYFFSDTVFLNLRDVFVIVFFLGVIPLLAYPAQSILPAYKARGREGQRKLAFIFTLIGYTFGFLWALFGSKDGGFFIVCATYFFSVILLTVCNVLHFKASGHSSSFTGPILILTFYLGWGVLLPCLMVATLVSWASLKTKRHTMTQLVGGMIVCLVSFGLALLLV